MHISVRQNRLYLHPQRRVLLQTPTWYSCERGAAEITQRQRARNVAPFVSSNGSLDRAVDGAFYRADSPSGACYRPANAHRKCTADPQATPTKIQYVVVTVRYHGSKRFPRAV